jgi:hypothetical protein
MLAGLTPHRSPAAGACRGGALLIPVHWREVLARGGRELSRPARMAAFSFCGRAQAGAPRGGRVSEHRALRAGTVHGLLLHWDLLLLSTHLDPEETLKYSTAPPPAVPVASEDGSAASTSTSTSTAAAAAASTASTASTAPAPAPAPWQDHWVQVACPLPAGGVCVRAGDVLRVALYNDGVSMWLDLIEHVKATGTGTGTGGAAEPVSAPTTAPAPTPTTDPSPISAPAPAPALTGVKRKASGDADGGKGGEGGYASTVTTTAATTAAITAATTTDADADADADAEEDDDEEDDDEEDDDEEEEAVAPMCTCGWHMLCGKLIPLPCPALPCPALPCLALPCPALPALPCPALFCLVLSCLALH